jgi:predicted nucleic acid-binding protein
MTVMDASVAVEILLRHPAGLDAFDRARTVASGIYAPHLIDIEVMHALRRLVMLGEISSADAGIAVEALPLLRIERHPHLLLLPRVWQLRNSLSAYDAAYVALAEMLDVPLLTCDAKLARSHGHRARIELLT